MLFAHRGPCLKYFLTALALSMAGKLSAEDFRVHALRILTVSQDGSQSSVTAGINDSIALRLPEDATYVEGIEVSFKVPQSVADWRGSVAWSLYSGITPVPAENKINYSGNRAVVGTFGPALSLTLQIPLTSPNNIKKSAYTRYLSDAPAPENGMFFLRLQLAMKGTSDDLMNAKLEISARPILIDKGRLELDVVPPDGTELQSYTTFIDGKNTDLSDGILLSTGSHDISLVSDFYRDEFRTVTISQAQSTMLRIQLRDIAPMVSVSAPAGTEILFDGEEMDDTRLTLTVTPGEHVLRFRIGDYEVVRSITAVNGRNYNVSVSIDTSVTEDD